MPKLWVDYTNHRGDRAWREIERIYSTALHQYPPLGDERRVTMCMVVKLADREESRTLALTSCHAFVEADEMPTWETPTVDERRALHTLVEDQSKRIATDATEKVNLKYDLATAQQIIDRQAASMAISAKEIGNLRATIERQTIALAKCGEEIERLRAKAGTIDTVLGELRDLRKVIEDEIDADDAPDDLPENVKASFPPGTKFKMMADGMWLVEEPNDTCTCPDCVERREKAKPDLSGLASMLEEWAAEPEPAKTGKKVSIEDVVKGMQERGELSSNLFVDKDKDATKDDCDCPACTVRRALAGGHSVEDFAKAFPDVFDGMVQQVAEKVGEADLPDWFNAAVAKIRAERKPAPGAEARGRNATYTGRFDDDASVLSECKRTLAQVFADHPQAKYDDADGFKIALPLWDAARVITMAGSLDFETLFKANKARQKEWDKDGQLVGPLGTLYRSNELVGEAGEVANKVKKFVREQLGIGGSRATKTEIADELADVVICCDLLAADIEIDLAVAVRRKFNQTSVERELRTLL